MARSLCACVFVYLYGCMRARMYVFACVSPPLCVCLLCVRVGGQHTRVEGDISLGGDEAEAIRATVCVRVCLCICVGVCVRGCRCLRLYLSLCVHVWVASTRGWRGTYPSGATKRRQLGPQSVRVRVFVYLCGCMRAWV